MNRVIIIGAGINGMVAANYLQRHGFSVTVLEKKSKTGGACSHAVWRHKGKKYVYPDGASTLGFMQDFIYRETGLSERLTAYAPSHPEIVLGNPACLIHDDMRALKTELRKKWNEKGDIAGFLKDMEKVIAFIRDGYKKAKPPTLTQARRALGARLVSLWITGSARNLLDHYLTSDRAKQFFSIYVTESGSVPLDSPYSAFSIPLMSSGSIFGGKWGHVKGGIWTLTETLQAINDGLGVKTICSAAALKVDGKEATVTYLKAGKKKCIQADYIVFATDPLTAAYLTGNQALVRKISRKKNQGSSGKMVLIFRKPAVWKNDTGLKDFDAAFRFIMPEGTLSDIDRASKKISTGKEDFIPGCYEIYCEGAANRKMGGHRDYDLVSVFFKTISTRKKIKNRAAVKKAVKEAVLAHIKNPQDLLTAIFLTPADLKEKFFFPGGNIDHVALSAGQTFFDRTYSADPERHFYQFGNYSKMFYCAAGTYPCGSVAGTPGYMCAQEIIRKVKIS